MYVRAHHTIGGAIVVSNLCVCIVEEADDAATVSALLNRMCVNETDVIADISFEIADMHIHGPFFDEVVAIPDKSLELSALKRSQKCNR